MPSGETFAADRVDVCLAARLLAWRGVLLWRSWRGGLGRRGMTGLLRSAGLSVIARWCPLRLRGGGLCGGGLSGRRGLGCLAMRGGWARWLLVRGTGGRHGAGRCMRGSAALQCNGRLSVLIRGLRALHMLRRIGMLAMRG
ncbi:hypothetical protein Z950_2422 [Sulfitobacter mediterraneus KCTC 32188]|nr:hypothetical protein Z950_2422 [Sulfitobacter mediterraneus KCTC 32188]